MKNKDTEGLVVFHKYFQLDISSGRPCKKYHMGICGLTFSLYLASKSTHIEEKTANAQSCGPSSEGSQQKAKSKEREEKRMMCKGGPPSTRIDRLQGSDEFDHRAAAGHGDSNLKS